MSLSMLKVCASSCGVLSANSQFSTQLNDSESNCLKLCATNIKNTYSDFQKNTHEILNVDGGDDEADDDEEDDE